MLHHQDHQMTPSSSSTAGQAYSKKLSNTCTRAVLPFAPGLAHALTTVAVGFPFDTIKTRVQVGMHASPLHSVKSTIQKEGFRALYRGAWTPLISLAVKRPCEFAAFEWCNKRFGKSSGPISGGFTAGLISAVIGCPFNVVKVQMQASEQNVYRNTFVACREVWRSNGFFGFYRGLSATLIMSLPSTTFYLGAYGMLRERLPQSRWNTALAGMVASLSMWTCLLPLDNVRTNIQAKPFGKDKVVLTGWIEQATAIVRGPKGFLGLWAGWTAVVVRAPIVSSCAMVAYEQARTAADTW
eukprot:CAMPEP_0206534184 /NCGR_PEP_ID=MMETSP0325_2-20121206/5400_1 /ASSEMBLY_ACC=CAM_ASM_000347 /TAXON_ID=2866 /ORGANISM="Crypthecodinium cohnii, Strain Seligo" /LENGTH=296 /DNA_ID=CAMNT_0054030951 /DNA_START=324 /DNA_END=1211 /DNA_ORIENTATION=-